MPKIYKRTNSQIEEEIAEIKATKKSLSKKLHALINIIYNRNLKKKDYDIKTGKFITKKVCE